MPTNRTNQIKVKQGYALTAPGILLNLTFSLGGLGNPFTVEPSITLEIGNLAMGENLGVGERTWEFKSDSLRLARRKVNQFT